MFADALARTQYTLKSFLDLRLGIPMPLPKKKSRTNAALRLDRAGKTGAQHTPGLTLMLPWLRLLDVYTVSGQRSRR
jgi:hypothetical protein